MAMITLNNICMNYGKAENMVHALSDINLEIHQGDCTAVIGKSGCGKSTLMNILGGITSPTSGEYHFNDRLVSNCSVNELSKFRNQNIGFVVQHFALIPDITVSQNIELPLKYRGMKKSERSERVSELLEQMELTEKEDNYPYELSGGQNQRVAIARAIAGKPSLLLADEPTGALDEETGRKIMQLFLELNRLGMTILIVTHDKDIADMCRKKISMKDGKILQ